MKYLKFWCFLLLFSNIFSLSLSIPQEFTGNEEDDEISVDQGTEPNGGKIRQIIFPKPKYRYFIETLCLTYCIYLFSDENMRIIGGEEVDSPTAYPYQVFIEKIWNNTAFFKCGGTIYNERYIITAGHCTYFRDAGVYATPKQIWVTAGTIDLASTDEEIRRDKQVVGVSEIHTHPQFEFKQYENDRAETPIYDIAVLKLKKSLKLSDRVAPLQIPPEGLDVKGTKSN